MRYSTKAMLRSALAATAMALGFSLFAGCTSAGLNGAAADTTAAADAQNEQAVAAPPRKYTRQDAAIQRAVDEAHAKYRDLKEGKNADYIPALAKVDSNLFGVAVVTTDGRVFTAGDAAYEFSVQS